MDRIQDLVREIIAPILRDKGIELVNIEYKRDKGKSLLRVFIDKPEGVNIENCREVSEEIGPKLERVDFLANYVLEVSSPGLTRPLKKEKDYLRFKGKLVKIKTFIPLDGQKNFKGRLKGLENKIVKIESQGALLSIPLEKIAQARLEIEL
jgi:ribosome maturation factor RimP